jgi:hypothetical protein
MVALVEGAVGDALEELGVVPEGAHVAPVDVVRAPAEVVVAERLEARQHLVDLLLPGDEGGERVLLRLGSLVSGLGTHRGAPRLLLW